MACFRSLSLSCVKIMFSLLKLFLLSVKLGVIFYWPYWPCDYSSIFVLVISVILYASFLYEFIFFVYCIYIYNMEIKIDRFDWGTTAHQRVSLGQSKVQLNNTSSKIVKFWQILCILGVESITRVIYSILPEWKRGRCCSEKCKNAKFQLFF